MKLFPDSCFHIYNQGNNHERLFTGDDHYLKFLERFQSYVVPHCDALCWCLMPNHFHFLIHTDNRVGELIKLGSIFLDPITNGFRKLLSTYAHDYNLENERSGALFRPKTKSKNIIIDKDNTQETLPDQDYFTKCFHYIHNNPVAAGLVKDPEDWKWSSYRFYTGRRKVSFCNKGLAQQLLGIEQIN